MKHTIIKLLLIASLMCNAYAAGTMHKPATAYDTRGLAAIADSQMPIDYMGGK